MCFCVCVSGRGVNHSHNRCGISANSGNSRISQISRITQLNFKGRRVFLPVRVIYPLSQNMYCLCVGRHLSESVTVLVDECVLMWVCVEMTWMTT